MTVEPLIGHLSLRPEFRTGDTTDAGSGAPVGLGHVSRCVALGTAWVHAGGTAELIASGLPETWMARCAAASIQVLDGDTVTSDDARPIDPARTTSDWTAFDGYSTTLDDQQSARQPGQRVIVIDDHGTIGEYDADILVDQNLGACAPATTGAAHTLLGPRFLLLRDEFLGASRVRRERVGGDGVACSVLLAAGGQPSEAVTALFAEIATLARAKGIEVDTLNGRHDVVEALSGADIAVAAAGSTAYELCCTGTPTLLFWLADNQEPVARRLHVAGAALTLGAMDTLNAREVVEQIVKLSANTDQRSELSTVGQRLVDAHGARRVVAQMRSFDITLRRAVADDADLLWRWSNAPEVRANSISTAPIEWSDHVKWLAATLASPHRHLFVATLNGHDIGQIRFDVEDRVATLGFTLARPFRRHGLAAPLLIAGGRAILNEQRADTIRGWVKPENVASLTAFDRAAFQRVPGEPMTASDNSASNGLIEFRLDSANIAPDRERQILAGDPI